MGVVLWCIDMLVYFGQNLTGVIPFCHNRYMGTVAIREHNAGDEYVLILDDEDMWIAELGYWVARRGSDNYVGVYGKMPRSWCRENGHQPGTTMTLSRLLMHPVPAGMTVDHVNRNPLDNRRSNLRLASLAQQARNRAVVNPDSGYKGVCWRKQKKRWQAKIKVNGKQVWSHMADTPRLAAIAYDEKALELHGEFAVTNKMLGLLD